MVWDQHKLRAHPVGAIVVAEVSQRHLEIVVDNRNHTRFDQDRVVSVELVFREVVEAITEREPVRIGFVHGKEGIHRCG